MLFADNDSAEHLGLTLRLFQRTLVAPKPEIGEQMTLALSGASSAQLVRV